MRVLVTGGTGFLGRRVIPLLAQHDLLCISRHPERLPNISRVNAVVSNLMTDDDWIPKVAEFQPEWCFHLAWEGLPDYSLERCRLNLDSSLRLLDVLAQSGLKRIVIAGTCWEYGRASGLVTEDQHPTDVDLFAATKASLLGVLDSVARSAGFEYQWARIFFVYGPGQRLTSLLPSLRHAYVSGVDPDIRTPETLQDFIHVDDVATGLVSLVSSEVQSGVFNVGSGYPTSVAQVANIAADYYNRAKPFTDISNGTGFWSSTEKIMSTTGWRPRIGIDEGIVSTLKVLDGR